jgi:anthraniloyl-CoA monooxygenase
VNQPFRIVSAGGGPSGLYFSLLMKQAFPSVEIDVFERNAPDDTFGWGVVFSDETLGHFERADPQSYAEIRRHLATWGDIETFYGGTCVRSTGHGFCGLSRKTLLQIFQRRCTELGVRLHFHREIRSASEVAGADLVLAADGLNSVLRTERHQHFRPSIDWRTARFCWLGTDKPLSAFTFIFREGEHGLFQVHAYPFQKDLSTFIVECHEDTWRRAGLDKASEEQTIAYCERLFAPDLGGHRLLGNRSIWRAFPTVINATWHHGNMVLVGDAAHTAHFSIGSGTKLAMEDAIALLDAFRVHAGGRAGTPAGESRLAPPAPADVPGILAAYEEARRLDVLKVQKAAQTSLEWFENSARYVGQEPLQFTFNLMTRSKRITFDNLALRDPALVASVADWFWADAQRYAPDAKAATAAMAATPAAHVTTATAKGAHAPPPMFAPFRLRGLQLGNRIVVSPMCQYSAQQGVPTDWHVVHLGSRAVGGAGLVISEMTNVSAEGRITHGCAGLWNEEQRAAWSRVTDFVHAHSSARIGMQLAHAGRKGSCRLPWEGGAALRDASAWQTIGPSALPFAPGDPPPRAMDRADMDRVREDFTASARLALAAGFDLIELHMAHGYLLSSFLSPAANRRTDAYGGSLGNRLRFPLEVLDAVRAAWPEQRPLAVRISATDWKDAAGRDLGLTADDAVAIARALKEHGCDLVDVSSGGNSPESVIEYGRMYQVPFADRIRHEVPGLAVMTVGAIQGADHANTVLAAGRADLCAIARAHLSHPYLTLDAAAQYAYDAQPWPKQYLAVKPRPKRG